MFEKDTNNIQVDGKEIETVRIWFERMNREGLCDTQ